MTQTPKDESASDDKKDELPAEGSAQNAEAEQDATDASTPEQDDQEPKNGMLQTMPVHTVS